MNCFKDLENFCIYDLTKIEQVKSTSINGNKSRVWGLTV